MLSQSRFDEDRKRLGLLEDRPDVRSVLTLQVRDPQVNMAQGERPTLRKELGRERRPGALGRRPFMDNIGL
jgi:hypothetical protein